MFKIKKEKFGKFTQIKLVNTDTGEYFAFIPDFGACLNDLVIKKNNRFYKILNSSKNYRDLTSEGKRIFKGSKLFPFPNRIKDGKYQFGCQRYQLPINFPSENHAIHGLILGKKFKIIEEKVSKDKASVKVEFNSDGHLPGYPFKFKLNITFSFSKENKVTCQTTAVNTGKTPMPIGDGWHPYFQTGTKINQLHLKIPSDEIIEVDKRMIPTEKIINSQKFIEKTPIGNHVFDTCYKITKGSFLNNRKDYLGLRPFVAYPKNKQCTSYFGVRPKTAKGRALIKLYDPKKNITLIIWQEIGKGKYNYVQIHAPPSRNCIAIEPMTCPPDAFNNKKGLIILKPEETFKASFGINILK